MAIFGKKTEDTKPKAAAKSEAKPAKTESKSMKELYAEKEAVKGSSKTKTKVNPNGQAYRILVKPLITEKAATLNSFHKYAFVVANDANKISVAKAVEEVYNIKPLKVNIVNISGKNKVRGRIKGKRKDWRKAIVTLPAGSTLDVYEGV